MPEYKNWTGILFNIHKPSTKAAINSAGKRLIVDPDFCHYICAENKLDGLPLFGLWPFIHHPSLVRYSNGTIDQHKNPSSDIIFGWILDAYISASGDFHISGSLTTVGYDHFNIYTPSKNWPSIDFLGLSFDSTYAAIGADRSTDEIMYLERIKFVGATIVQKSKAAFRWDSDFRLKRDAATISINCTCESAHS